jgi:hypothetical protein
MTPALTAWTGLPGASPASSTWAEPVAVSVLLALAFSVTVNVSAKANGGTVEPDSSGKVCVSVTV